MRTEPKGGGGGRRGALVVLAGIDGCGKTTQVARLARTLAAEGVPVETGDWRLEDVDGTFVGDLVRRVSKADLDLPPETATLLLAANLSYRLERRVRPALAAGKVFVEDDSAYKMMARAVAHGLDAAWVGSVFRFLPAPDLGIVLDLAPERALARIGHRVTAYEAGLSGGDRRGAFLRHQADVRDALLALARARGFAVLAADGLGEEELAAEVLTRARPLLARAAGQTA